jgi:hypothetical protein
LWYAGRGMCPESRVMWPVIGDMLHVGIVTCGFSAATCGMSAGICDLQTGASDIYSTHNGSDI